MRFIVTSDRVTTNETKYHNGKLNVADFPESLILDIYNDEQEGIEQKVQPVGGGSTVIVGITFNEMSSSFFLTLFDIASM